VAIGFEFEIAGLAVLHDLEAAAGDLGWVVHAGSLVVDDSGEYPVGEGVKMALDLPASPRRPDDLSRLYRRQFGR
jgi:hypothetical protein